MKKLKKILWIMCFALLYAGAFFTVPVFAGETEGEYLGTLGPGESISTKGIAYGIYQISGTCIASYGGWCSGCSSGGLHTYAKADAVNTTYSICVDGYPVVTHCSTSATSGTVDLSEYSSKDAVLTMPANYGVRQRVVCVGGNIANSNDPVGSCGYSFERTISVTGTMKLYGYSKKPEVTLQPVAASAGTDQNAVFSVSGNKVTACRWQKVTAAGITDLSDGTDEDGVTYSGTGTLQLTVSRLRTRINGASFRCVLIGENGDEVATEAAPITVSDVSGPKVTLSYTPTDKTEGEVTIRITASDPDSGLCAKPYHYQGADHETGSFSVKENGTYEVKVTDAVGNSTTSSITISNIRPKEDKSSSTPVKTESTQNTQPVMTVVPLTTTGTNETTARPASSVSTVKEKKQEVTENKASDQANREAAKNVNIRNLTTGPKDPFKDQQNENAMKEEIDAQDMLSEAPEEEVIPESLQETESGDDPVATLIMAGGGLLVLLALLFLALLFPVRVENADELGNWHFCALKMLRFGKSGWELRLGLLLEDFDSLRLKFGMLFMALIGNSALVIKTSEGETITIEEVTQDLILHYNQIGGLS